ncbi:MAG: hypothetical protein AAB394_01930 [Patescibacteria group bacterium]
MLSPEQLAKLSEITNPIVRQRFVLFYQLPPDMQESMLAEDTAKSIWNLIKEKYHMPEANISTVARIIGLIFLGELPIKNFIAELKNKLNVDVAQAQAIAQDINQSIFQPVRVSLMQVHGIDENTNTQNTNYKQYPTNQNQQYKIPPRPQQPPLRQGFVGQAPSARNYGVSQQPVKLTPPAYQPNYNNNDAQKRREEVLNKIRQQPPSAKPASFYFSRNIRPKTMKAKHNKRVTKYNSFFS